MLNRSKHTGDGHAWNTMLDMEVDSLRRRGGVRNFGRGVREKGVQTNPRTPPWLRACLLAAAEYCLSVPVYLRNSQCVSVSTVLHMFQSEIRRERHHDVIRPYSLIITYSFCEPA